MDASEASRLTDQLPLDRWVNWPRSRDIIPRLPGFPDSELLGVGEGYGALYRLQPWEDVEYSESGPDQLITPGMLSKDQLRVFNRATDWILTALEWDSPQKFLSIGGVAGSGKSTVIATLIREMGIEGLIVFACFTGKAVNVGRRKMAAAGIPETECRTLHSLLYTPIEGHDGGVREWIPKPRYWYEDQGIKLIIVDEASMLNKKLSDDLVNTGVSVLLVGDHAQLPPIPGPGGTIGKLNMNNPSYKLEQIHRQASGSPVIQLSVKIRTRKPWKQFESPDERVTILDWKNNKERNRKLWEVMDRECSTLEGAQNTVVLCRFNDSRTSLSADVRRSLRMEDDTFPEHGDPVICLKNTALGPGRIYNGMRGYWFGNGAATDHHIAGIVIFPDENLGVIGRFNRHQFDAKKTLEKFTDAIKAGHKFGTDNKNSKRDIGLLFDWAGAMTCHKAQGSQWKNVIVYEERPPAYFKDANLHHRWLYTAVTRAAERVYISPA